MWPEMEREEVEPVEGEAGEGEPSKVWREPKRGIEKEKGRGVEGMGRGLGLSRVECVKG